MIRAIEAGALVLALAVTSAAAQSASLSGRNRHLASATPQHVQLRSRATRGQGIRHRDAGSNPRAAALRDASRSSGPVIKRSRLCKLILPLCSYRAANSLCILRRWERPRLSGCFSQAARQNLSRTLRQKERRRGFLHDEAFPKREAVLQRPIELREKADRLRGKADFETDTKAAVGYRLLADHYDAKAAIYEAAGLGAQHG
jgi:hypothetical protein